MFEGLGELNENRTGGEGGKLLAFLLQKIGWNSESLLNTDSRKKRIFP